MARKKSDAQLQREIDAALATGRRQGTAKRRRFSHSSKSPVKRAFSLQDQIVELLMQHTDEAREVARDLLLDRGVIKTGQIAQLSLIGEDFAGDIYRVLLNDDNRRYWTAIPRTKMLRAGDVVDYVIAAKNSPGLVSAGDEPYPRYQLRIVEFPGNSSSEDEIVRWLTLGRVPLLLDATA